jgi:hypothetical protein
MHHRIYLLNIKTRKSVAKNYVFKLSSLLDYNRPHTSFDMLFLVSEYTHIASNFVTTNYHSRLVCVFVCLCVLLMAIVG